ncbi:transposase, partial [Dietzia cinnamea]|uniref:transposase n=1 Tax=Dietzia cinnamea TaxID=321318 RepID=UPI0021AFD943
HRLIGIHNHSISAWRRLEGTMRFPRIRRGISYKGKRCQRSQKYDREFREGAVRIVEETGKPIAQIARDLGVNAGTLGNWVNQA